MNNIEITKNINLNEWNDLLSQSPQATIFHTKEWLEVINRAYSDREIYYILSRKTGGELICGLPIIKYKRFGLFAITSTIWGTPLLRVNEKESVIEEILDYFSFTFRKSNIVYLSQSDFFGKCNHLSDLGFEIKKNFSHRLKLNHSIDYLWNKSFTRNLKRNIKKAINNNFILEEVKDISQVNEYYNIAKDTYIRHGGKMIYPFIFYKRIFEILSSRNATKWYLIKKDNKIIAGSIHLLYNKMIFNLLTVSYKKYQSLSPINLLTYSIIKWGCENNYESYDFGSSPEEADGLIRFKESWGAKKIEYLIYEKKKKIFKIIDYFRKFVRI